MGIGPVPATRGLLERTGEEVDDFGLVELNEAFASQTLYCQRELGIDDEIFNVNGGAISIGIRSERAGAPPRDARTRDETPRRRTRTRDAVCRVRTGSGDDLHAPVVALRPRRTARRNLACRTGRVRATVPVHRRLEACTRMRRTRLPFGTRPARRRPRRLRLLRLPRRSYGEVRLSTPSGLLAAT